MNTYQISIIPSKLHYDFKSPVVFRNIFKTDPCAQHRWPPIDQFHFGSIIKHDVNVLQPTF